MRGRRGRHWLGPYCLLAEIVGPSSLLLASNIAQRLSLHAYRNEHSNCNEPTLTPHIDDPQYGKFPGMLQLAL
jgi:hypothetical protein